MAQPAIRAQPFRPADHGAEQFVRVQLALHQRLGPAFAHEFHRALGGGMGMGHVDDLEFADIEIRLVGGSSDLRFRPDENRADDALARGAYGRRRGSTRRRDAPRR